MQKWFTFTAASFLLPLFVHVYVTFPGQQEVSSPHLVSMTTEPTHPPSLAAVLCSPNLPGNETGSRSTGSDWLSLRGCFAALNTETTSGTTSAAGPPGTRRRTEGKLRGEGVSAGKPLFNTLFQCVNLWKSTVRSHSHQACSEQRV